MKKLLSIVIIGFFLFQEISAQQMSADELIRKSVSFHDPNGVWPSFQSSLNLIQENPKNENRKRKIFLDIKGGTFKFEGVYPEGRLQYEVENGQGKALWNNSESIIDSIKSKYRITDDRALMYRNYYSYLYGMPMKLRDKGTVVHPDVETVVFHGKEFYKIKVSYDESVGNDTWYFYFNKATCALGAYEFWKKVPGDGEYLLLEGIKEIDGVKLPEKIAWYMTIDDRWLGTDVLN